ncbi:C39 family peptidase [Anaerotignum propionicum]|uniref:Peptidase_C39 like family protein n=1 Tax=Anaerotignum propionicum DSM 1682 TaxID=991789 RepID=A0A0X8VBJ6_ANAPI|nr:C39 family peptidase [Anaerotignum propionicum]AMJ41970.1 hypothetical protein CPRO_24040 [Anaerotignum propionicum DSM 1682]SHE93766.1 Peptidase_C39 like family protein [[Clostridium] propionicum DSM 1682] [Anaerotignum propionicum DSM 1682]
MKPILYMQNDPKWASHDYSAPGEKTTIKAEGCGITCAAMVIATLADKTVTPITTAEWSKKHGYKAKGQGTYYSYFKPQGAAYGIDITMLNSANIYGSPASKYHELAREAIERGDLVITCMGKGNWTTSGHYVLWYGLEGGKVQINDPWSNKSAQINADYNLFKSQVKFYWVVKVPDEFKEDENMKRYNTLNEVPSWAKPMVKDMQDTGCFSDKNKMDLSDDMLRAMALVTRYLDKKK